MRPIICWRGKFISRSANLPRQRNFEPHRQTADHVNYSATLHDKKAMVQALQRSLEVMSSISGKYRAGTTRRIHSNHGANLLLAWTTSWIAASFVGAVASTSAVVILVAITPLRTKTLGNVWSIAAFSPLTDVCSYTKLNPVMGIDTCVLTLTAREQHRCCCLLPVYSAPYELNTLVAFCKPRTRQLQYSAFLRLCLAFVARFKVLSVAVELFVKHAH